MYTIIAPFWRICCYCLFTVKMHSPCYHRNGTNILEGYIVNEIRVSLLSTIYIQDKFIMLSYARVCTGSHFALYIVFFCVVEFL
jgi:hypothetical protein